MRKVFLVYFATTFACGFSFLVTGYVAESLMPFSLLGIVALSFYLKD